MTQSVSAAVTARLKAGPEQQQVVGPIVELLLARGWDLGQMMFGKKEWVVPKAPAESNKRERHQHFDGYPVDIAIFSDAKHLGDYETRTKRGLRCRRYRVVFRRQAGIPATKRRA